MKRHLLETLPMPLARAYRQMYDQGHGAEAYHFCALFIEPLIKWYGALALVTLRLAEPQRLAAIGIPPRNLSFALGHWSAPLQAAVNQPAANLPPGWQAIEAAFEELRRKPAAELKEFIAATEEYAATSLGKRSVLDFLLAGVAYRNRTRGHGAPTTQHQNQFTPLLLAAYDALLPGLDSLGRLKLIYLERAEILGASCVHTLRECQGLFSTLLPEKWTCPKAQALSSQAMYLFSADLTPLVELSPLLIRPTGRDALYFLNSCAGGPEYLSYDGTSEEFYRPESFADAIREFFGVSSSAAPLAASPQPARPAAAAEAEDLGFGNLGMW
jgi:hypothetical protein